MIASGFYKCNSQWHIPLKIASGYHLGMRGIEKIRNRAARLRLLNNEYTFEEMAKRLGGNANPRYLSQIANEYLGKGRKTPRSLSDNYASRLETCFGLENGWFDIPIGDTTGHGEMPPGSQPSQDDSPLELIRSLKGRATERSIQTLNELEIYATKGTLTDEQWKTLSEVAKRFAEN